MFGYRKAFTIVLDILIDYCWKDEGLANEVYCIDKYTKNLITKCYNKQLKKNEKRHNKELKAERKNKNGI